MAKDNRKFKRYTNKSELLIRFEDKIYSAKMVDYSVDGICAEVNDSPDLSIGDVIKVDIAKPRVKSSARVVWAVQMDSGMKVGITRIGILYGSLQDFTLSDILIGLQRSGKNGVLHIMSEKAQRSIYFNEGDLIFASSNQASERFGDMLVGDGKLTVQQYEEAVKIMKSSGKRLGTVLVDLGYLESDKLSSEVLKHVERIILGLFELKGGDFMFRESNLTINEPVTLKMSAANIIYRGIKKINDINHIEDICPPEQSVLSFSQDPLDLFQDLELDKYDKKVLSLIDGNKNIKEILAMSPLSRFETLKTICGMLSTKVVELKEIVGDTQAEVTAEEVLEQKTIHTSKKFINALDYLYANYETLGYYGVLGITENASSDDVKRAYYAKAMEFHPDKHFHLPEEMKEKLNTVFSYITSAYSTLISNDLRREYDRRPEKKADDSDPALLAQEKFEQGREAMWNARFRDAARLFSEAAYLQGNVSKYHFYCGVALFRNRRYKEAERSIQRALRIEPFNADYLAEVGHVYFALGFSKRAKGNFDKALKIKPRHKRALEGLSKIT